jgi:hypothetical protein
MSNPTINLVRGRKPRVLDQFVGWALSIGRAVIILTELIALGAFLYRFGLDRQLVDLHDKIAQEQSIVSLLKQSEDTYRNLQYRLSLAKTIMTSQAQSVKLYADILTMMPADTTLKTLIFDEGTVKMSLDVTSVTSLGTLIDKLKNYPNFSNVSLDKLENKTTVGLISASITTTIKGGKAPRIQ